MSTQLQKWVHSTCTRCMAKMWTFSRQGGGGGVRLLRPPPPLATGLLAPLIWENFSDSYVSPHEDASYTSATDTDVDCLIYINAFGQYVTEKNTNI